MTNTPLVFHNQSERVLMNVSNYMLSLGICCAAALLGGCASSKPIGAVIPMQGGTHQSVVQSMDSTQAMKSFDHDAKLTCGTAGAIPALDKPGNYVVVSQNASAKGPGKIASSDDKRLDAGIAVGMRYLGLEGKESVELTTVFRCQ